MRGYAPRCARDRGRERKALARLGMLGSPAVYRGVLTGTRAPHRSGLGEVRGRAILRRRGRMCSAKCGPWTRARTDARISNMTAPRKEEPSGVELLEAKGHEEDNGTITRVCSLPRRTMFLGSALTNQTVPRARVGTWPYELVRPHK